MDARMACNLSCDNSKTREVGFLRDEKRRKNNANKNDDTQDCETGRAATLLSRKTGRAAAIKPYRTLWIYQNLRDIVV
jgi:hypothetical protein